jgi:hypothetical protein
MSQEPTDTPERGVRTRLLVFIQVAVAEVAE